MKRALDLAQLGKGRCSPNPMVGCVIVHNQKVIGEGWHRKAGEAHAEVNAINSVKNKELLKHATLYVTLEPCSHHGKTPPCCELIVNNSVRKVVIAKVDPNPLVAGGGISFLKNNDIEVVTGVLEELALTLNSHFFKYHSLQRPFITLKWAQSQDGYMDPRIKVNFDGQIPISGPISKIITHKLRAEEDAILIGKNTLLNDAPQLTVRNWKGKNPIRLLIDPNLEANLKNLDHTQTWVLNNTLTQQEDHIRYVKIDFDNFIEDLYRLLFQENVLSLFIEGGAYTLDQFIKSKNWDRAITYTSQDIFGSGLKAPEIKGNIEHQEKFGNDTITVINR